MIFLAFLIRHLNIATIIYEQESTLQTSNRNAPLLQSLFLTVEIGKEIPAEIGGGIIEPQFPVQSVQLL